MKFEIFVNASEKDPCGVERYARRFAETLLKAGEEAILRRTNSGSLLTVFHFLRGPGIKVFHYPGYRSGTSLGYQIAPLLSRKAWLVLHEFSSAHPLRRLSLIPALFLARRRVLFVDETEAPYPVEPVGAGPSFLPAKPPAPSFRKRLIFLGRLRKDKKLGLLRACMGLARKEGYRLVLCGGGKWEEEFDEVVSSDEEIASVLLEGGVGIATFSRGVSRKRTSLLTLLAFGLPTLVNEVVPTFSLGEEHGVVVFGDEKGFVSSLRKVEKNYNILSIAAFRAAREELGWDRVIEKFLKAVRG